MGVCNVDIVKRVGKCLNVSVGAICYNSDKVLTTVINKQNIEGFASIVLYLSSKSGEKLTELQRLLAYQWLEYISLYADQAVTSPNSLKTFLQDLNRGLERNTYLTGQFLTVADIAAYHVLYTTIENLSIAERETLLALCRWFRHIQFEPKVAGGRHPLHMDSIFLAYCAPLVH